MDAAPKLFLDLCAHLQLAPPEHGPDSGAVGIDYGNDLLVFLAVDAGTLLAYSRVGELPAGHPQLAEELLEANLFGQHTGAATLALEPFSRAVVLQQRIEVRGWTLQDLESCIGAFADQAQRWTQAMPRLLASDAPAPTPPASAQIV